jgi:hypothetical protein
VQPKVANYPGTSRLCCHWNPRRISGDTGDSAFTEERISIIGKPARVPRLACERHRCALTQLLKKRTYKIPIEGKAGRKLHQDAAKLWA